MKKVDGFNGRNFLFGVLVTYFFTFFFSYFYFMVASPIIIGNAIIGLPVENNSPNIVDPALIKTFEILGVLILIVLIVYVIPKKIYRRQTKHIKLKVPRYKAFRNQ